MQRKIIGGHKREEWEAKFRACGQACYYCAKPLTLETATKDHVIPRCRDGVDYIENIVPACFMCNAMKGGKTEEEFRRSSIAFSIVPPKFTTLDTFKDEVRLLRILDSERNGTIEEKKRAFKEASAVSWAWRNPYPG